LWLMIKVLLYAKWKEKWKLVKAIWKWTFYRFFTKKKDR
jgi:hypothetical protein